jgi:Gram-negative bacterial TonB protein C-terminal
MRAHAIIVAVVAATLAGCGQAPQRRAEVKKENTSNRKVPPPRAPEASFEAGSASAKNQADVCADLEVYPLPRTYAQILADVPKEARKPTGHLEARMLIDPDGNISHIRFMRLSSVDSINKHAFDFVTKQHYKPTVVDGQRVSVCTSMSINIDF